VNQAAIRRIDRVVGNALCFALTAHRRAAERARPAPADAPSRRILLFKLVEQGATVVAADAIRRAVDKVGRDNVFVCVFRENRPILDILDLVPAGNIVEIGHDSAGRFAFDALRALRKLRAEGIDTVVDLEFFARAPAIFAYLTGARRRVGLDRFTADGPYRGDLLTHRVQYNPYLHASVAYSHLIEALDADPGELPLLKRAPVPPSVPPKFVPAADERARVQGLLDGVAGRAVTGPIVLLNANTGDLVPLRVWPIDRFVALGKRVLAEFPAATLVLTGAPSEKDGVAAVEAALGAPDRVVSMAGRTTLRELLVLYTLADVLVTSDSGPGHFASLTDIANVVIFGPETPTIFGPAGDRAHVLYAGLACSPCVSALNHRASPCADNRCMQAVSVDAVFAIVADCLR
jgi:ADP-heptose:LPS heptosyltransferase